MLFLITSVQAEKATKIEDEFSNFFKLWDTVSFHPKKQNRYLINISRSKATKSIQSDLRFCQVLISFKKSFAKELPNLAYDHTVISYDFTKAKAFLDLTHSSKNSAIINLYSSKTHQLLEGVGFSCLQNVGKKEKLLNRAKCEPPTYYSDNKDLINRMMSSLTTLVQSCAAKYPEKDNQSLSILVHTDTVGTTSPDISSLEGAVACGSKSAFEDIADNPTPSRRSFSMNLSEVRKFENHESAIIGFVENRCDVAVIPKNQLEKFIKGHGESYVSVPLSN